MKKSRLISRKVLTLAAVVAANVLISANAFAAGEVATALSDANTKVRAAFKPVSDIMLVIMAIVGIVGAISVYSKWSNGDPDTRKSAAGWFGALIFAGLVLVVIKAVFGVS